MSNAKTVTGKVVSVIRHGHTYYNNPMLSLSLQVSAIDGTRAESSTPVTLRVSNNAALVYGINNPEYANEFHTYVLTPAGRISTVRKVTA